MSTFSTRLMVAWVALTVALDATILSELREDSRESLSLDFFTSSMGEILDL